MALTRRKTKALLIFAILMAIFPPWIIRKQNFLRSPYGPPHAAGYSFIMTPPSGAARIYGATRRIYPTTVARIDIGRLFIQYIALGALAAIIALPKKKRTDSLTGRARLFLLGAILAGTALVLGIIIIMR